MNLDQGCPVHCESGPENQHGKKKIPRKYEKHRKPFHRKTLRKWSQIEHVGGGLPANAPNTEPVDN